MKPGYFTETSDIYPFAGKVRTVNISKPDSPVSFCYVGFILPEPNRLFSEFSTDQYLLNLPTEDFSTYGQIQRLYHKIVFKIN